MVEERGTCASFPIDRYKIGTVHPYQHFAKCIRERKVEAATVRSTGLTMSLLMPDINLRRNPRHLTAYWHQLDGKPMRTRRSHTKRSHKSSRRDRKKQEEEQHETHSNGSSQETITENPISPPASPNPEREEAPDTLASVLNEVLYNQGSRTELDFTHLARTQKKLKAEGGSLLARVLTSNHTIYRVILSHHDIGADGARAFSRMLCVNTTLEYVDLSWNQLTDEGAESIAQALYGDDTVSTLILRGNKITDNGALKLAEALKCNLTVRHLDLSQNDMTAFGADALRSVARMNEVLETIDLTQNYVPHPVQDEINAILCHPRPMGQHSTSENQHDIPHATVASQSTAFDSCSSGFLSISNMTRADDEVSGAVSASDAIPESETDDEGWV